MDTKQKIKLWVASLLKLCIVACACVGIMYTSGMQSGSAEGNFMGNATFNFFTIQSNVWAMMIAIIFLVFSLGSLALRRYVAIPNWLYHIKFMCTTAVTLTFLVFSLMLTPSMIAQGYSGYLTSASNICCHNLVPILTLVDFFVFDSDYKTKKGTFLLSAVLPVYYLIYALVGSVTGMNFGQESKVPYFFLDYEANGWFTLDGGFFGLGVVWWILILVVVVLAYSAAIIAIKNSIANKRAKGTATSIK